MLKNSGPHCHHQLVNVSVNVVVLIFPNPRRTDASLVVAVDGDGWRWHRGSRCCLRRSATDKRRDGFFLTVVGVDVDDVGGVGFDATPNFRYLMRLKRGFPPASSSTTKLIWGGFNLTWNWSSEFFFVVTRLGSNWARSWRSWRLGLKFRLVLKTINTHCYPNLTQSFQNQLIRDQPGLELIGQRSY